MNTRRWLASRRPVVRRRARRTRHLTHNRLAPSPVPLDRPAAGFSFPEMGLCTTLGRPLVRVHHGLGNVSSRGSFLSCAIHRSRRRIALLEDAPSRSRRRSAARLIVPKFERQTEVHFAGGYSVSIERPAAEVIEDIEEASDTD